MKGYNPFDNATICALASAPGVAAIAVIRVSGPNAIAIVDAIFAGHNKKNKKLSQVPSHTVHYGNILAENSVIDNVIVNIYKNPKSYTGEDSVEIFCHGSLYIQQKIIETLIDNGCRLAHPGEFTFRAFINGKLDLSQAEAVADLIAANSKTAHDMALKQMKGGFSKKIEELRQKLIKFTALIELELDFSEEDVEFADRKDLLKLIFQIEEEIKHLSDSFSHGNVLKKGIPVAIIGKPNVGKSTLLNALLNEEKAIVSAIPGTTRDAIEDTLTVEGYTFRFIDTAGLRATDNEIESMGVNITYDKIKQASIILFVFDISATKEEELQAQLKEIESFCDDSQTIVLLGNKSDMLVETPPYFKKLVERKTIFISAKRKENINMVVEALIDIMKGIKTELPGILVSNSRHYEALTKANNLIREIISLIQAGTSHEFLAADLRRALLYLSEITGAQIDNEAVLDEIFSTFCIGK